MPTQKQIEALNFKYDTDGILKCLWAIKNGAKEQFMVYGESWINKVIQQRVAEGVLEAQKSDSTFKKSAVFKEAFIKHSGDMYKIMKAMEISARTYFRHKKDFVDAQTKEEIRKKKFADKTAR